MKTRFPGALLANLSILFLTSIVWGQAGTGEITGQVFDNSGAAVEKAGITVTNEATGQAHSTLSASGGVYAFPALEPGSYAVQVTAPQFRSHTQAGIRVHTGERLRVDVRLAVGEISEAVTVRGEASLLQSESANLQQVIDHEKIVSIPLNGRTFIQLATLAPGVAFPPGTLLPRINGGRPRTNEYLFDGISALQPEPGQVAFFPVIDAIQEFNIQSNSVSSEFGRFNGGVVNLSTRSGSNAFHGSVFEFLRNEALNARNYFAPTSQQKPEFRRNQYGATLGGPIVKDHTFFFVDYQGAQQSVGTVRTSTVPTLLQRQGIFTEPINGKIVPIFDPATTQQTAPGTFTRAQFANNSIPAQRMDPVAVALLNRYPLPTSSGTANNFVRVGNDVDHQNQFDARADHKIHDKDQVFGRYSYFHDVDQPVTPLPDGSGNITSGAIGTTDTLGQQIVGNYLHIFNDRVLNDLRFGYTRRSTTRRGTLLDAPASQSLKIPGIPSNSAFENALPTFAISGVQQLGSPTSTNSRFQTDVTQVVNNSSWQLGRHLLRFGLDFRWERLNAVQPPNPSGLFQFTQLFTDQPGKTGTGNALASFLLGQVQQFSIDLQQSVLRPRAHIQEYFIQDDWKATRRLTVDAGLRWTLNFPSIEASDQGAVFNLQTQQLDFLGKNGISRSARELHWHDFGPRLGIAYMLNDKTVVRSGYGLVWIEQTGITTPFTTPQFPFLQTVTQRTLDSINPAFTLASGPSVAPIPLTPDAGLGQGVFSVNRRLSSGYVQQWNLAVEREVLRNTSFQIAYAGSLITHVGIPDVNSNQLTPAQLALGTPLLQRVPNPFFGAVPRNSSIGDPTIPLAQLLKPFPRFTAVSLFRNNTGSTNYHAIEARLEQRLSHGISYLISFTHSRLIDTASSVFDSSVLTGPVANFPVADSYNLRRERDASTGDIPNVLVASYTIDLPFGPGHHWKPEGVLGKFANGWQLSGIVTLQSGMPVAITQATNFNSFAGFGIQRPNVIADPNLASGERSRAQWFNTGAFVVAPQFTIGNASRNPVRGPHYHNADLALIKHTRATVRLDVEFRTEVFNLTNTPAFAQPNGVLGSSGFGTITATVSDPRVVQFGLKLNY